MRALVLLLVGLLALARADVYMHMMRGSNNRLDAQTTNVENEQRLFDSQNNAKGGYNYGYMYYYMGSHLTMEWTNQHGAGANPNVNSEIIIQYLCDDVAPDMRDGTTENTITLANANNWVYGRHETPDSFARCSVRERNKGLYTANQNPGTSALHTRQNPGGTVYGFECTEERDYYPYWHPSEWRDLAVLTSNTSRCDYYKQQSQNVMNKGHCELTAAQQKSYNAAIKSGANVTASDMPTAAWVFNNASSCTSAGYAWLEDSKFGISAPYCGPVPTTRDNHLGNALNENMGRGVYASMYNLTLPHVGNDDRKCVMRIRYNVSTGDYNGWTTYADSNGKVFPAQNNPQVTIYNATFPVTLQLQVNTAQFGRTFQDRTHVFDLKPNDSGCKKIYNLNVRGKRGNIVQVYPAVEYDFVPERLHVHPSECVHMQWTGSNTNPAGNTGQGVDGSDRSNFMQMHNQSSNYPSYVQAVNWMNSNGVHGMKYNTSLRYYTVATQPNNQGQSNDASPYFDGGLLKFHKGTYFYVSTRNNDFSNRSQKGMIISGGDDDKLDAAIIAGIVIFGCICIAAVIITWAVIGTRSPDSSLGTSWGKFRDFFTGFVDH